MKQFIALLILSTLTMSQFVNLPEYVSSQLCNYDPECIQNYPEDLSDSIMCQKIRLPKRNGAGLMAEYLAVYDNNDEQIFLCPSNLIPNEEGTKICALYLEKNIVSLCTSQSSEACLNGQITIPRCCWSCITSIWSSFYWFSPES